MWVLETTDEFVRRHKRFEKDSPRELKAVLDNLDTYFQSLIAGAQPLARAFGFLHTEPHGVVAIDQKGGGKSLAQTRLYVYPDQKRRCCTSSLLAPKGFRERMCSIVVNS